MNRTIIKDEYGDYAGWFDRDKAQVFEEARDHDGRNLIPRKTGDQWSHQRLYRTAKGKWVIRKWSDWQGSRDSFSLITQDQATAWLIENNHAIDQRWFQEALAASEL